MSIEIDLMREGWQTCRECLGTGLMWSGFRSKPKPCLCGGSGQVFGGVDPNRWPSFYGLDFTARETCHNPDCYGPSQCGKPCFEPLDFTFDPYRHEE